MQVAFETVGFSCAPTLRKPDEVSCENSFWRTFQGNYRTTESSVHWGKRLRTIPGAARRVESPSDKNRAGLHSKKTPEYNKPSKGFVRFLIPPQHYTALIRPTICPPPPGDLVEIFGDVYKTERYRISGMDQLFAYSPETAGWVRYHQDAGKLDKFDNDRKTFFEKAIKDHNLLESEKAALTAKLYHGELK